MNRTGTVNEAAALALFLLSEEAAYFTGSQYAVDGGLLMRQRPGICQGIRAISARLISRQSCGKIP